MRLASVLLLALPFSLAAGVPDSKLEVTDLRNHPFSVDLPSGSNLKVHLRSGDFHIRGRDAEKVIVRLEGRNAENAKDLTVRFERTGADAHLRVFGGPKNDLQVVVEVPKSSSLFVRMPAGDLTIEDVVGSKDVQLHAGDLTISASLNFATVPLCNG